MLPIGSTTIGGAVSTPARCSSTASVAVSPAARSAWFCASWILVLQARVDWPFTFTPQEPQIAARHEQRTASEPSWSERACSSASSTDRLSSSSTSKSSQ